MFQRMRGAASGRLRAAVGVAAAALVVAVPVTASAAPALGGTALGGTAPGGPGNPAAGPVAAPAARVCTLAGSAHASGRDEHPGCLRVDARLDTVPALRGTARLHVEITAEYAEKQVRVEAELPANLVWAQVPAGLDRAQVPDAAPETGGRLDRATATLSMAAGVPRPFDGVVRAVGAGAAQIRVRALVARGGGNVDAAEDSVFLTVGGPGTASAAGIATGGTAAAVPVPAGARLGGPATPARYKPVGTARRLAPTGDDPARAGATAAAATACVTGNWSYVDNTGTTRPSRGFGVQVWDADDASADDLLVDAQTDGAGHYHLCFDNTDGEAGTQDIYLRFVSENPHWRVYNGSSPFAYRSVEVDNVATGSDTGFGNLHPGNSADMRGLHAFDEAQDAWNGTPGACWDLFGPCRQLKINWSPSSTDGTFYGTGDDLVHLKAADPDAPTTVVHEIGHAIMDDVYEDNYPATAPNCGTGHPINGVTSVGCAWSEGFAEWFPLTVYGTTVFSLPSGNAIDLENASWDTANFTQGDVTEGRVAGALLDLNDPGTELFWDHYAEAPMDMSADSIWHEFQTAQPVTFADFWARRTADRSDAGALAALYQNTIDYGFREPLGAVALTRPTPTPHNYRFDTTGASWSVVGIRAGVDLDLDLYDDRPQASKLATSQASSSTVDFIAIDSAQRGTGDYYPRVRPFNGATGSYLVQHTAGSSTLPIGGGSLSVPMSSSDVVAVVDTVLLPNSPATITVSRLSGSGDAELFVLGSTSGVPSTFVQPRANALASASSTGPGGTETVTVTAPALGHYAVVIVNKSGTGTYTLTRS